MRWIVVGMGLMVALIVVIAVLIGTSSTGSKPKHHRVRIQHPNTMVLPV